MTLVAANVALAAPPGVSTRATSGRPPSCRTPAEREFPACDVLLMAAAVADFTPAEPREGKIKKAGRERLELELEPTPDMLSGLSRDAARRARR